VFQAVPDSQNIQNPLREFYKSAAQNFAVRNFYLFVKIIAATNKFTTRKVSMVLYLW